MVTDFLCSFTGTTELTTIVLTTLSKSSAVPSSPSLRVKARIELIFRFLRVKFLKGDPEPIFGCGRSRASLVCSRLSVVIIIIMIVITVIDLMHMMLQTDWRPRSEAKEGHSLVDVSALHVYVPLITRIHELLNPSLPLVKNK